MAMFLIGANDFSANVVGNSYNVYLEEQATEWQDGNWKQHYDIHGEKVRGNFDMLFPNKEDYDNFLTVYLAAKNAEGCVQIAIKVNDRPDGSDTVICYAKLTIRPTRRLNDLWQDVIERFTVEVAEV